MEKVSDAAIQAKRDELKAIDADLARLTDEMSVVNVKVQFLDSLRRTWGGGTSSRNAEPAELPTVEHATQALAFLDQWSHLLAAKRNIEDDRGQLEARKEIVSETIFSDEGEATVTERRPVLRVAKFNAAPARVSVDYRVGCASWLPAYELRAADGEARKVELAYYADLWQNSGENWQDLQLTFSTAEPEVGLDVPVLEPVVVAQSDQGPLVAEAAIRVPTFEPGRKQVLRTKLGRDLGYTGDGSAGSLFSDDTDLLEEREEKEKERFEYGMQEAVTHATFTAAAPQRIPSSDDSRRVLITTCALDARPRLRALPRVSDKVYLTAEMVNTCPLPLLPGIAKVFLGSDYLGEMELSGVPIGARFSASFGGLRQFKVSRKVLSMGHRDAGMFGDRHRAECTLQIRVENLGGEPREVEVWEAMPVARQKDVSVTVAGGADREAASHDARRARQDNIRVWLVTVQPGEDHSAVVDYSYSVEWDREQYLYGPLD